MVRFNGKLQQCNCEKIRWNCMLVFFKEMYTYSALQCALYQMIHLHFEHLLLLLLLLSLLLLLILLTFILEKYCFLSRKMAP